MNKKKKWSIPELSAAFCHQATETATAPSATASLKTLMWIGKKVEGFKCIVGKFI